MKSPQYLVKGSGFQLGAESTNINEINLQLIYNYLGIYL